MGGMMFRSGLLSEQLSRDYRASALAPNFSTHARRQTGEYLAQCVLALMLGFVRINDQCNCKSTDW